MAGGINPSQVFSMISGIGDAVVGGLKDEYQRQQANQLGDLIAKGDLDGASAAALRGGNMELGLKLQELKLSRAAQQTVASGLGNLYTAGGGGAAGGGTVDAGGPARSSTGPATSLPTFAQGTIPESVFGKAIASQESGGRYDIVGPTHPRLGRALGKHQIMEANLPSWSEEAIGRVVSPQEFLSTPAIQEAIFADRFGKLVQKYGNVADAASAWHSGRPLAQAAAEGAHDRLGTRTPDYVRRFMASLPPQWRGGDALSNLQAAAQEARGRLGPTGAQQAASLPAEAPLPPTRVASLGGGSTTSDAPPAWAPAGMTPQQRADLDAAEARANGGRPAPAPAPAPAPEPSTAPAPTAVAALPSPAPVINAMPGQTGGGPMPAGRPMVLPGQPGAIAPAGSPPASAATPAASLPPARVAEVTGAVAAIPKTQDRIPALIRLATTPGLDKGTQALLHDLLKQELESTKLTDVQKNYLMARGQGYTGTLPEFADRMRPAEQIEPGKGVIRRDPQGNITTTVPLPANEGMFPGKSPEAAALNHLVQRGILTPDQAANVAAGKTITNPADGSMIFMTPQGLAGQMPGQPPRLLTPSTLPPGPAATGATPAPAPATAAPAPAPTAAAPAGAARPAPPPPAIDPNATVYRVPADIATPAGAIRLTPGKPGAGAGTEAQTNAGLFANLTEQAERVFSSPVVAAALTAPVDQALWRIPIIGSAAVPDAFRQAKQAELNFTTAWLRKTSGAAINQGEYTNAENTFFPRPWDDPGTLAQKAQARRIVIDGLKTAAGPAYHPPSEAATPTPPPGGGVRPAPVYNPDRERQLREELQRRGGGR
jgi:hypothetical protein